MTIILLEWYLQSHMNYSNMEHVAFHTLVGALSTDQPNLQLYLIFPSCIQGTAMQEAVTASQLFGNMQALRQLTKNLQH